MMIEGTFLAPRRIRALITLGGVAVVCACSSTHPTATVVVTPADFARHIDSLYAATGNTNRQTFLTYLEYAPAFGATPTVVRLSPGGVEQIWKGYVWEDVAGADSTSVLIAYSDATVAMGLFLLQKQPQRRIIFNNQNSHLHPPKQTQTDSPVSHVTNVPAV